jgi:hypothetical protein
MQKASCGNQILKMSENKEIIIKKMKPNLKRLKLTLHKKYIKQNNI